MENLTLNYFDARGRGECVRLLLAAAGVEYKDNRVTDWAPMKPCKSHHLCIYFG